MAKEKEDYMTLHAGDFSEILGSTVSEDSYTHLGVLFSRITACGRPTKDFIMSRESKITCPECIAETRHRQNNPSSCREPFGVVTYKK